MNLLSDVVPSVTPPLQENYHNDFDTNTIIIVILAILVVILFAVLITLLYLNLKNRKRLQQLKIRNVEFANTDLSDNEKKVLSEYRKLDQQGKELVHNTIQTLNSKSNKD